MQFTMDAQSDQKGRRAALEDVSARSEG